MMKKFLALLLLPFILSACVTVQPKQEPVKAPTLSSKTPEYTPESTPTPEDSQAPSDDSVDAAFANAIREDIPKLSGVPDKSIADTARAVCSYLDTDPDLYNAVSIIRGEDNVLTVEEASFFVGASIGGYCIRHKGLVDELDSSTESV